MELARTPNPPLGQPSREAGGTPYVAKWVGRAGGAMIQPKGMTACCSCAVSNGRSTL
jgi:hypothetical protein